MRYLPARRRYRLPRRPRVPGFVLDLGPAVQALLERMRRGEL